MAHLGANQLLDEIDSILQCDGTSTVEHKLLHRRYASADNLDDAASKFLMPSSQSHHRAASTPKHAIEPESAKKNTHVVGEMDMLDSILADLEPSSPPPMTPHKPAGSSKHQSPHSRMHSSPSAPSIQSLDTAVFVPSPPSGKAKHGRIGQSGQVTTSTSIKKCFRPLLGTSRETFGHTTITDERCCDNLRCTKCDFKVTCYSGHRWDNDVEYLFFRNHYPETVVQKLIKDGDSSAYCCQCSWISVKARLPVDSNASLGWICGGHAT